jgi:hypothetical protein
LKFNEGARVKVIKIIDDDIVPDVVNKCFINKTGIIVASDLRCKYPYGIHFDDISLTKEFRNEVIRWREEELELA